MAMTKDQIIEIAKEAGFARTKMHKALERFAQLVAATEREACANVAEKFEPIEKQDYIEYASTAIRARGQ